MSETVGRFTTTNNKGRPEKETRYCSNVLEDVENERARRPFRWGPLLAS